MAGVEVRAYDQDDNALRAAVYVDGQKVGQAPGTFTVFACSKSLEVKLEGYATHSAALSLGEQKTSSFKVLLKKNDLKAPDAPKNTAVSSNDGMVKVPAGKFTRGSNSGDVDEKPMSEIYLNEYWIDIYEVTVDQYRACVDVGKCSKPDSGCNDGDYGNWDTSGRGKHPVNCVSWTQADQYCRWSGKRLPTEAEWEKAARGTDGRTYPWGEQEPTCEYTIMNDNALGCGKRLTWPVGSKPKGISPYGVHDMSGNVWEWVADWYDKDEYKNKIFENPMGPMHGLTKVRRGGGFSVGDVSWLRSSVRSGDKPSVVEDFLGFRCAK
jgi:formylglycine-generating enzyme required for sulfatase activity